MVIILLSFLHLLDNKYKQNEEKDLATSNTDSEGQKTEGSTESAAEKDEDQKPIPESSVEASSADHQTPKENSEGETQTKDLTEAQEKTEEKANDHTKDEEVEKMDVDPSVPDSCSKEEKGNESNDSFVILVMTFSQLSGFSL